MERNAEESRLELGSKAPYFSLRGTDGRIYSLTDFSSRAALVVIFTANHCPYAQAYETRISELAERFTPQNVGFVAICANDGELFPEDNFENMVARSERYQFPYPYLHDESQEVAKAYDARCTPEAYLFDANQLLRYHGAIDDNFADPSAVTSHFLADAISAVLRGEPVPVPSTTIIGCNIKLRR